MARKPYRRSYNALKFDRRTRSAHWILLNLSSEQKEFMLDFFIESYEHDEIENSDSDVDELYDTIEFLRRRQ